MHKQAEMVRHYSQLNFNRNQQQQSESQDSLDQKDYGTSNQVSNQQFEYYSFNNGKHFKRETHRKGQSPPIYEDVPSENHSVNTYRSFNQQRSGQLLQKYSSLYEELQSVETRELIFLFIEEIEENQKGRKAIAEASRRQLWLEQQLQHLQELLEQKRQAISRLCETESKNLDLMESMQKKLRDRGFVMGDYYYARYSELEKYMTNYICSTKDAQEEMMRKLSLVKSENERVIEQNEGLSRALFEVTKLKDIVQRRQGKGGKQKQSQRREKELNEMVSTLREENSMMKKDIEVLIENLRSYEQFQIDLNKDNREISSSLQFLRERLSGNCSIREGDLQRVNFSSKAEQAQQLRIKIQQLNNDKQKLTMDHSTLMEDYQKLCSRLDQLTQDNANLICIIDQNNKYIAKLKGQFEVKRLVEDEMGRLALRRGQTKSGEATHDSLQQSCSKTKSGFITNCNSSSKVVHSRTGASRFSSKQNESNNF